MKENELRIGNLFIEKDEIKQFDGDFYHLLDMKPIPLTEEWFEKFGFEKISDTFFLLNVGSLTMMYYVPEDYKHFIFELENDELNIKYIHQLQNLFFALTGEELTISNAN
jgi:hypothetical protein